MMPRRPRSRTQQRAATIAAERRANLAYEDTFTNASDSDPPPF